MADKTCETCRWARPNKCAAGMGIVTHFWRLNPLYDYVQPGGERRATEVRRGQSCGEHTPKPTKDTDNV